MREKCPAVHRAAKLENDTLPAKLEGGKEAGRSRREEGNLELAWSFIAEVCPPNLQLNFEPRYKLLRFYVSKLDTVYLISIILQHLEIMPLVAPT